MNDVASVGSLLVAASRGRDVLYQPARRHAAEPTPLAAFGLLVGRALDWREIGRCANREQCTHLHVHYGSFAMLAAGRAFSLHLHGGDLLLDLASTVRGGITRWGIRHARHVVVSTPNLIEPARTLRPDAAYVSNPMPLLPMALFDPLRPDPQLLLLSKLDALKGWDSQVALVRVLCARLPGLRFKFLTSGQLPAAIRDKLIRELVSLGGEPLPVLNRSEFLGHVRTADFAIGQMEVGALGMSELEAMAAGVPTVADARAHALVGPLPPVINNREAAVSLEQLWANPEARISLAHRTRSYIEAEHDPVRSLRTLEALIAGGPHPRCT